MIKKILISAIVCIFVLVNMQGVNAQNNEDIGLTANFAFALDMKQEMVLYQKNKDERMFPASMTKIATVITALEMIEDLNKTVVIQKRDLDTIYETSASAAYFTVNETVTYKDLIYGAILPSGADATRALAFNLSGELQPFVDKMNELVKKLKLKNTNFTNTTGIHDDNHYTTASDLAYILKYALENKDFKEALSTYAYKTSNGIHNWVNTGMYFPKQYGVDISKIIACKSGYTEEASNCLASLVDVNGRETIVIVAKTDHKVSGGTAIDTNKIIQYCSDNYGMIQLLKKGTALKKVDVAYSASINQYEFVTTKDINLFLPKAYTDQDVVYTYKMDTLTPEIKKGDPIGEMTITFQGKELYKEMFESTLDIKRDNLAYIQFLIMDHFLLYMSAFILIVGYIALYLFDPKTRTFRYITEFIKNHKN